jgi:hypothetical protein
MFKSEDTEYGEVTKMLGILDKFQLSEFFKEMEDLWLTVQMI